jgi:hypothetical protein
MNLFKPAVLAFSLSIAALPGMANDDRENAWEFNFYVEQLAFDEEFAVTEGVGDSAWGFGLSSDFTTGNWITSIDVKYIRYDDEQQFSQRVIGTGSLNSGDVTTEESTADAITLGLAFGPSWYFGEDDSVLLYSQLGYTAVLQSNRSIGSCSDCGSEDIELDNGGYLKFGANKSFGAVNLGAYAIQYVSGNGIENGLGVSIGTAF